MGGACHRERSERRGRVAFAKSKFPGIGNFRADPLREKHKLPQRPSIPDSQQIPQRDSATDDREVIKRPLQRHSGRSVLLMSNLPFLPQRQFSCCFIVFILRVVVFVNPPTLVDHLYFSSLVFCTLVFVFRLYALTRHPYHVDITPFDTTPSAVIRVFDLSLGLRAPDAGMFRARGIQVTRDVQGDNNVSSQY